MNDFAAMLPWAFGSHGEEPANWHPASGSGKTRPSAWYWPSFVATGAASAVPVIESRTTTSVTAKVVALPCTGIRVNTNCQRLEPRCTVGHLVGGGSPSGPGCRRPGWGARRSERGVGDDREQRERPHHDRHRA